MPSKIDGFHVFGRSSAFKFEQIANAGGTAVLSIDGAPLVNSSADWQLKTTFQITPAEHVEFLCFLLGLTRSFKVGFHGPKKDKSIEVVNQPDRGSLFLKVWESGRSLGIELKPGDAFQLGALALRVLSLQTGFDSQTALAVLRGTAGRLFAFQTKEN